VFGKRAATLRLFLMVAAAGLSSLAGCIPTPDPATNREVEERVAADLALLFRDQEPLTGPVGLYEAMARAIKYNYDYRLRAMEHALAQRQFDLSKFSLLPEISGDTGYIARNAENISSSDNLRRWRHNLMLSWNFLDFGISFIRAQQQADRVLVAEEQRRRTVQTLVQDVRRAFWQAAIAQSIAAAYPDLRRRIETGLEIARREEAERLRPLTDSLRVQQDLLASLRQLQSLRRQTQSAQIRLAALMNVRPSMMPVVTLDDAAWRHSVPDIDALPPVEDLEILALISRPELRSEDYQERIGADQIKIAMLQYLPGFEFFVDANNENNNAFIWSRIGSRLLFSLNDLVTGPSRVAAAESQRDLARTRRVALSLSILTQVNLAHSQLISAIEDMKVAEEIAKVARRRYGFASDMAAAGLGSPVDVVQREAAAFLAEVRRNQAYSEVRLALATLHASLGLHPLPDVLSNRDIRTLAAALRTVLQSWETRLIDPDAPLPEGLTDPPARWPDDPLLMVQHDDLPGGARRLDAASDGTDGRLP